MKLEDPSTIRTLKIGSITFLVILVAAEFFVHPHPHFGIDGTFGFYAWYGFLTCVAMVVLSKKLLGALLSREDSYYDD